MINSDVLPRVFRYYLYYTLSMKKATSIPDQAKKIFTTTYGRVAGISLIGALANIAVVIAMEALLDHNYAANIDYTTFDTTASFADLPIAPLIGTGILATLLILLIAIIVGVSITTILMNNKSFAEAIGFGITKGLRSIPVQALFALLLFAGSIPGILIIFLGALMASETLSLLFIALGACLLLLPIVILVRGMFIVFIWVEQQKERAWAIIKKSFALTKGSVGWMVVLGIAVIAAGAGTVGLLLLVGLSALGIPLSTEDLSAISDEVISVFLTIPALYALLYAIYQHAKTRGKRMKKKKA